MVAWAQLLGIPESLVAARAAALYMYKMRKSDSNYGKKTQL